MAKTLPLSCASTALVAKAVSFLAVRPGGSSPAMISAQISSWGFELVLPPPGTPHHQPGCLVMSCYADLECRGSALYQHDLS